MTLTTAVQKILDLEGRAFENHPLDRGGPTKMGITQATYDRYRAGKGLPLQSVGLMDEGEAVMIYGELYWTPMRVELLPDGLDFAVFQAGVNFGVTWGIKLLQMALGVTADGKLGPVTLAAVKTWNVTALTEKFFEQQKLRYEGIVARNPSQEVFLKGWFNRVKETAAFVAPYLKGALPPLALALALGTALYLKRNPHAFN